MDLMTGVGDRETGAAGSEDREETDRAVRARRRAAAQSRIEEEMEEEDEDEENDNGDGHNRGRGKRNSCLHPKSWMGIFVSIWWRKTP